MLNGLWRRTFERASPGERTMDDVRAALAVASPPLEKNAHTLVIPTYNRPEELRRLTLYLESAGLESRVLVLDSSPAKAYNRNRSTIRKAGLDIEHLRFSPDLNPYEKLLQGFESVRTPFCSACADDDFIVLPGLRESVRALEADDKAVAAHGFYVNFQEGFQRFNVSFLAQHKEEINGQSAFDRVSQLMSHYHALFYAVQRTEIARASVRFADGLTTMLGREIASTALIAAKGSVRRVALPYLGRSTAASLSYHAWHPHQVLCERPSMLFDDYAAIRGALASVVDGIDAEKGRPTQDGIDIVFLRYLSDFLRHEVLNFVLDQRIYRGNDPKTAIDNLWRKFVVSDRQMHRRVPLFADAGDSFAPGVKHPGAAAMDYLHRFDIDGVRQTMMFYHEFFFGHGNKACLVGRKATETLARSLFLYAAALAEARAEGKARRAA
jgi:glycosyltransferase domain-containing protein